MRKSALLSSAFVLLVACGDGPAPEVEEETPDDPTAVPRVEDSACRFSIPAELGLTNGNGLRCGDLVVYENREIEDGPTIRLHFVQVFGAESDTATIYLDGGPGGDGNSILGALATGEEGVREALLAGGDFLSISQRGTGLSIPALMCDQQTSSAAACAAQVEALGDLPAYNTANNADDIDELRQALGYDKLNLYGISYGSRLALEVLRRHPENVRAAIAGGTVPAHVVWPAETPANFYGAVNALAASCEADAACFEAYGDISETVVNAIASLNEEPQVVSVFGQQFPLDGNTYAALLFQLLYSRATYGILPLAITDLAEGRTDRVLDTLLDIFLGRGAGGSIAQGMYFSVVCGEIFNPVPEASVFEDASAGLPQPILDAMAPNWFSLQSSCQSWPVGRPLPELSEVVTAEVPTFLSNGQLDPITPPTFGAIAKEGLANAQVIDFANSGHGSTLQSPCGVQVLTDFLASPDQALDASCAAEIDVEFVLPTAAAPAAGLDIKRIRREIERAPTPPWIRERIAELGALSAR
ncbi:MAG: alpha/beta hydrolase [Deltaproteobacteria bacterium]|nr:alpha/beta hydrolase [Deltaproteobacteria bacterium]